MRATPPVWRATVGSLIGRISYSPRGPVLHTEMVAPSSPSRRAMGRTWTGRRKASIAGKDGEGVLGVAMALPENLGHVCAKNKQKAERTFSFRMSMLCGKVEREDHRRVADLPRTLEQPPNT